TARNVRRLAAPARRAARLSLPESARWIDALAVGGAASRPRRSCAIAERKGMTEKQKRGGDSDYRSGSLSLIGAVSMGTGVMVGAGIFALTGQMAEQAGGLFPLAFLSAAVVAAFSAYSYIKLSAANPSAGGIAMYLKMAYGEGTATAGFALLMYFSMVINE